VTKPSQAFNPGAAMLVLCALAVVFWRTVGDLVSDWSADANYSHGFLVVPAALWLVWEERQTLRQLPLAPSGTGLAVVVTGILILLTGVVGADRFLTEAALPIVIAGSVLFLWGARHLRAVAFAVAFLYLMIPLPAVIFNQVAFPLQLLASRLGVDGLQLFGLPVFREGNVIVLPQMTLEVAEACSGIRSLVALAAFALLYGRISGGTGVRRAILSVAVVPLAIVVNALRVMSSAFAANAWGPEAVEGLLHSFSGWVLFALSVLLLIAADACMQRLTSRHVVTAADAVV
jgi:exosortase